VRSPLTLLDCPSLRHFQSCPPCPISRNPPPLRGCPLFVVFVTRQGVPSGPQTLFCQFCAMGYGAYASALATNPWCGGFLSYSYDRLPCSDIINSFRFLCFSFALHLQQPSFSLMGPAGSRDCHIPQARLSCFLRVFFKAPHRSPLVSGPQSMPFFAPTADYYGVSTGFLFLFLIILPLMAVIFVARRNFSRLFTTL